MMSIGHGVCNKCNSITIECDDGLEFYSNICFFCGEGSSTETLVDRDYNVVMSNRQIPEHKNSYKTIKNSTIGRGVAYYASINNEDIKSKHFNENDYVDVHPTSWDAYDEGVVLTREDESDDWYENMIKEIETNPSIDKVKSYVTKWDNENKKLVLLYGDKLRFLRGSNTSMKETLDLAYRLISHIENESINKKDEIIEEIKERTIIVKSIIDNQIAREIVEVYNIIDNNKDDELKIKERSSFFGFNDDIPF